MKSSLLLLCMLVCSTPAISQAFVADSLRAALVNEKTDTGKAIILYKLSYYYQKYKPDSALIIAQLAYKISEKQKFLKGESSSLGQMANAFNRLGNYPKALQYYIEQLKIEEKANDPLRLSSVYLSIALVFNSENDTRSALFYAHKADSIAVENNLAVVSLHTLLNTGDIYVNADQLDSAIYYTMRCYYAAIKQKDGLVTGTALNNLGNIYLKTGKLSEALDNYKSSIPYLEAQQDYNTLSECKLGLAKTFDQKGDRDSALLFARQAFLLASNHSFLKHALDASTLLSQLYKRRNKIDSAFRYQSIMVSYKDSVDSRDRIRDLQNITISEQIRQKEIDDAKIEQAKARKQQLQLLAVGLFIPISFLLSVYISRRRVHKRLITSAGIFSILLLFEYITFLLHPIISERTGHSPVFEIIILVGIAALITPIHHRIENWLMTRLTTIHNTHADHILKNKETKAVEDKPV